MFNIEKRLENNKLLKILSDIRFNQCSLILSSETNFSFFSNSNN